MILPRAGALLGLATLAHASGPRVYPCGPTGPALVALDLLVSPRSTLRALALIPTARRRPGTLVVVHGGGWNDPLQRRHDVAPQTARWACALGVAALSAEYRLVREDGAFPGALDDLRATLAAMPGTLGLPGPRVLLGESAGGQLALLAATDAPDVTAVVAVSAPSDLGQMIEHPLPGPGGEAARASVLGHLGHPCAARFRARCAAASPITTAGRGPALRVVHSPDDHLVGIAQAQALVQAARAAGRDAALWEVSRASHPCATGHSYHGLSPCLVNPLNDRLVAFLAAHLPPR